MKILNNKAIVITDPCYIVKDEDKRNTGYNLENLSVFGFSDYISRNTIYGDWSCGLYRIVGKEKYKKVTDVPQECYHQIGSLCADAGMVCVVYLDELLTYNLDFIKQYAQRCYSILPTGSICEGSTIECETICHKDKEYSKDELVIVVRNKDSHITHIVRQNGF